MTELTVAPAVDGCWNHAQAFGFMWSNLVRAPTCLYTVLKESAHGIGVTMGAGSEEGNILVEAKALLETRFQELDLLDGAGTSREPTPIQASTAMPCG